ncbi:MAG: alpha-E domain-containing protein [Mogibacterium sp.]|nr:alpha-E domain-containing protein [Mogibacterium sp.]
MGTVTLSKLDNLYWLGRYIERVYQSIIMYKETYDKLIDQDAGLYKKECERMGIADTFADARDFAQRIAFDTDHPLSIVSNLYRAYDNAMTMRDEISSDTLAYIHLALAEMKRGKVSEAPLMELQNVEDLIFAFWGSLDDKVDNESVRNTVKVGKRIERLDVLLRREADREALSREMNRLISRIDTTDLPYDRKALLYAAAMVEDREASYKDIKAQVWEIIPPFTTE